MAKFHRVPVAWILGVPFAVTDPKRIAQLLKISAKIPRLQVLPNGQVATLASREETEVIENHLVTRVELMDVECLDCEEAVEGVGKATGHLADLILGAIAAGGIKVAKVTTDP